MPQTDEGMPKFSNLMINRPSTDYLLYMKCMACRIGDSHDIEDIKTLIQQLKLSEEKQVFEIIERYASNREIGIKVKYMIEDIFSQKIGE